MKSYPCLNVDDDSFSLTHVSIGKGYIPLVNSVPKCRLMVYHLYINFIGINSDQWISSFLNSIVRNQMCQTWSKQLENEVI